ncbi:hypothetical protein N0V88_005848 [Collariella sp. IMI 366227]|nr:hypothetical protein N0V88_005848 [Collariella sp. IMI 366227]
MRSLEDRIIDLDDDDIFCVYYESAHLPEPPISDEERQEAMVVARNLIQARYDAGTPLFTKEQFRTIVQQLDQCLEDKDETQKRVSVTGLDGQIVWFPVKTGKESTMHLSVKKHKCFLTKPLLDYHGIESLLWSTRQSYEPVMTACLPVELMHQTETRDAQTGLPVVSRPLPDVETLRAQFQAEQLYWEGSKCFAKLKIMFDVDQGGVRIPQGTNKVVAFACSTMTWPEKADDENGEGSEEVEGKGRDPPMAQHVLMLAMRELVQGAAEEAGKKSLEVKCYAQDPMYTPVDKQVLGEVGITVLDDPRGFLEVDDNSVVISISPNIPVKQIVADIARPAVVIWYRVEPGGDYDKDPW